MFNNVKPKFGSIILNGSAFTLITPISVSSLKVFSTRPIPVKLKNVAILSSSPFIQYVLPVLPPPLFIFNCSPIFKLNSLNFPLSISCSSLFMLKF